MERIVVGVDGSPSSVHALRWTLALADETGAAVKVVHAWELPYGWIDGYAGDIERWAAQAREAAGRLLNRTVIEAVGTKPRYLEVEQVLVEGPAAKALLDESKDADLLVIGTRGRGGFTGLLLGSVGQQCMHHARGPVVVVPEPE